MDKAGMSKPTNRLLNPADITPTFFQQYDCHDTAAKVSALAGLSEVEMNAVRLAASISGMSQEEWMKDILLASAESYISELGGQISLRD